MSPIRFRTEHHSAFFDDPCHLLDNPHWIVNVLQGAIHSRCVKFLIRERQDRRIGTLEFATFASVPADRFRNQLRTRIDPNRSSEPSL